MAVSREFERGPLCVSRSKVIQESFMGVLDLLDSERDKAINNYRGDLSDLTMGDILHWDEIFYYIGMEQRAKTAINKAFE